MLKINYKGYIISQANNNHVMICKDNQMLFHASCDKKLNKQELKNKLGFYLNLKNLIEKVEDKREIQNE